MPKELLHRGGGEGKRPKAVSPTTPAHVPPITATTTMSKRPPPDGFAQRPPPPPPAFASAFLRRQPPFPASRTLRPPPLLPAPTSSRPLKPLAPPTVPSALRPHAAAAHVARPTDVQLAAMLPVAAKYTPEARGIALSPEKGKGKYIRCVLLPRSPSPAC